MTPYHTTDLRSGVPQRLILGALLFNVFLNDLLMLIEKTEIYNFADDNTLYSCGKEFDVVMNNWYKALFGYHFGLKQIL